MTPTRESVLTAVFGLFTPLGPVSSGGNGTFNTVSRKLKLWGDCDPSIQPCLFMVEHLEKPEQSNRGMPNKTDIWIRLFIYAHVDVNDPTQVGGTVINNLLDVLDAAVDPKPGTQDFSQNVQTLSRLVNRVWQNGEIIKEPGDLDGQALAIVPIQILVP